MPREPRGILLAALPRPIIYETAFRPKSSRRIMLRKLRRALEHPRLAQMPSSCYPRCPAPSCRTRVELPDLYNLENIQQYTSGSPTLRRPVASGLGFHSLPGILVSGMQGTATDPIFGNW
jgi:hypothetical protein